MTNQYFIIFSALGSICALLFAAFMARRALSFSEGTDRMKKIASFIRQGANAYLRRQYSVVLVFFGCMFAVLCLMAALEFLTWFVPFAFITGGFFSGLSGFVGMKIATASNSRTANACRESLNSGLQVAFSAGTVMGFTVVGLGLLDISGWYLLLKYVFGLPLNDITAAMLTFGMGASSMALFARVGGGIFTKAADVGADLVGKVEAGIPEDDPRNPAAIADNVGDNVGDVAGMGADLYESYVGSILATFALGAVGGYGWNGMLLPVALAVCGILCSIIGSFLVKTKEDATQESLLKSLRTGTYTAAVLAAVLAAPLTYWILGSWGVYIAILCGLTGGCAIGYFTEYYTSDTYKPTQELAAASETGSATIIIGGVSLGLKSTMTSIIIVAVAVLVSYFAAGGTVQIVDGAGHFTAAFNRGLYGIGIAGVGMLSTLGITLATDAYGPVADNAGGIAEMSGLPETVRQRTDALDSLGNTTAATGKGFAIGSAALTALALIASYVEKVETLAPEMALDMSVMNPVVLVGIFVGACLAFIFAAITMGSVGKAAHSVVLEVRRQFKEIPGIIEGTADADFARCVDLCTRASLKEMVVPTLIAVGVPIVGGLLLGPAGVIGLLCGATASGFLLAVFMSNSGGSWDNAKKYVESGHYGGKGSKNDKSAIVGDTIGDPFKDTSGPAINILIKLLSMVSIVFATVVVNFHIFG